MALSRGELILSLWKLAEGRLGSGLQSGFGVSQSAPAREPTVSKDCLAPWVLPPELQVFKGHYSAPDLHQQVSLPILWTSTLMLTEPIWINGR